MSRSRISLKNVGVCGDEYAGHAFEFAHILAERLSASPLGVAAEVHPIVESTEIFVLGVEPLHACLNSLSHLSRRELSFDKIERHSHADAKSPRPGIPVIACTGQALFEVVIP